MSNVHCDSDSSLAGKNYISALGYHMRALQFLEEKKRVSLVFNVASVSVECYLLAICAFKNIMPLNHSYSYMLDSLAGAVAFDPLLEDEIRSLDEIFGICSLDDYHLGTPVEDDMHKVLEICSNLKVISEQLGISGSEE